MRSLLGISFVSFYCSMSAVSATAVYNADKVTSFELPWVNHQVEGVYYASSDHPNAVFVLHLYKRYNNKQWQYEQLFNGLASDYQTNPNVQILDIGWDNTAEHYKMWVEKTYPNHPVLSDSNGDFSEQLPLATAGCDEVFVLDCLGKLHFSDACYWGWRDKTEKQIRTEIEKLSKKDCSHL